MTKPGRNEPCYCGSGQKYKKCHMPEDKAVEAERRHWADAGTWLRRDLIKYGRKERFATAFAAGLALYWKEFYTIENAEAMSMNEALRFIDWFVFDYQHEGEPRLIETYRAEKHEDLSSYQQGVLETWLPAPAAAAFELLSYEGQTLQLRHYFNGEEFEVFEPAGLGNLSVGDLVLDRIVPAKERLEFSTVAAYIPQDEIGDLKEKMAAAREADLVENPDASEDDFLRRHNHLLIHHALDQAEIQGRYPVARLNPDRPDKITQKAAEKLQQLRMRQIKFGR